MGRVAIERALCRMAKRGPDGEGRFVDDEVALGHRRLAIIDLDVRASQPMWSACGRYVIVFNGEIYNYRELRTELLAAGVVLHTESDTEVILCLFILTGENMLQRLRGMFAIFIWDTVRHQAFAARDPYGIKPLYFARAGGGVVVASQVKALLATGLVGREPDPVGQAGFWLLGSVPEPHTWYAEIRAVRAGHYLWLSSQGVEREEFWCDVTSGWREGSPGMVPTVAAARERASQALRESVAAHLVADVPVGVFLSGGVDSGALAALMVEMGARDVQGVTIAYDEFSGTSDDEGPIAKAIANHYGIRHHVRRVSRDEFELDLPRIVRAMDQPSVDGVNTWYASKATGELGLKVVVSGVGGDELFQGYSSFTRLPPLVSMWQRLSKLPGAVSLARAACAVQAQRTRNPRWKYAPEWAVTLPGAWWLGRGVFAPDELPGLMGVELAVHALRQFSPDAWVHCMSGQLPSDPRLAIAQIESTIYLRNQLLRDSDWASMDHSVELRTPLVDAWLLKQLHVVLPLVPKFSRKRLLAQTPRRPLPLSVVKRPKTGFGIPVNRWLRDMGRINAREPRQAWARLVGGNYGHHAP